MQIPPGYQATFAVTAFAWGAIWGSFLNVVIWRLPRGASLSRPASHCPRCESPIRWYDNVPIAGWFLLGGRCRDCDAPISARYPGVEALVAGLSLAIWLHVADGRMTTDAFPQVLLVFVLHFYLMAGLVAVSFIDLDLTIIPHKLTMPLIAWGILGAVVFPKTGVWTVYHPQVDPVSAAWGAVAGFGLLFAVFGGYRLLRGIDGGGGGDLWLLAAIGANLGWVSIPFVLFAASFQGVLAAVAAGVHDRVVGREPGIDGPLLIKGAHRDEYWDDHPVLGNGDPTRAVVPEAQSGPEDPAHAVVPEAQSGPEDPAHAVVPEAQSGPEDPAHAVVPEAQSGPEDPAHAVVPEAQSGPGDPAHAVVPEAQSGPEDTDAGFLRLAVPFGPFLALAAIEYIFFGRVALEWATGGVLP